MISLIKDPKLNSATQQYHFIILYSILLNLIFVVLPLSIFPLFLHLFLQAL